jgi:VWFA-related protein
MFTRARLGSLLLACLLGTASRAAPQSTPSTPTAPPAPAGSNQIHLDVVVTAKSGLPVAGLEQQDFTLLDNKAPQTITSFRALSGRDAPVYVIVVIDAVNDTATNVIFERLQIDKFLQADGGSLKYPVGLAVFTDTGLDGISNFSNDGNTLSAALDKSSIGLRDIGRTAGYWGAAERVQLSLAALDLLVTRQASRPEHKVIVWVSPGWPLLYHRASDATLEQQTFASIVKLSTSLVQARVTLYNVDPLGAAQSATHVTYYKNFLQGISKPSQTQVADLGLQVLAVQSGGLVLNSSNNIASLLEQSLADAAPSYELSFEPSAAERPNEYHRLDVRVGKPGLVARTREGYYAQPSPQK